MAGEPVVGVLALQGDYGAHRAALAARGVASREVRVAADLDGAAGLVLPGGESTTMLRLLGDLEGPLVAAVRRGRPVLATCAGVILIAREARHPVQRTLGLLDAAVTRNAYGRQVDSCVAQLEVSEPGELGANHLEGVFIRAPRIEAVGPAALVLARRGPDPVLLRQGAIIAATFHPELSAGSPVVDLFVRLLRAAPGGPA